MTSEIYYRIAVGGVDLTPPLLPDDLRERVTSMTLRGAVSKHGREYPTTTIYMDVASIEEALQTIERVCALGSGMIDDVQLHVDHAYEDQCNLEFSADEVSALARAGGELTVSCWKERVAREATPAGVDPWERLSEIKTTPLWSGTVFRFPAKWPYEDLVDYMLVSDEANDGRALRMLPTTGRKAGLMNILCSFPAEAYVAEAVAVRSDWLKANWCEQVYDECAVDDVYVSRGYAAPADPAGESPPSDAPSPLSRVTISLTADEALVLFDLLSRWGDENGGGETPGAGCFESSAEPAVLNALSCLLAQKVTASFLPDYAELLSSARGRLASGWSHQTLRSRLPISDS